MTGYASGSVQAESLSLDFELKSVNSKSLDIKIYLPDYLSVLESELRQFILKNISRGSILFKIKANHHTELANHYILNDKVLKNILEKFENIKMICNEKKIPLEPVKASDFFAIKGVWEENKNSSTNVDEIKSIIFDKTNELLDNLQQARKEEGQGLQKILSEKLSDIMAFQMSAEKILPERSDHLKNNFKIMIDKIISEHSQLDENKIEQEIAIIAIKQDITEELDRLKVHISSMQNLLNSSGIVGKKLDFLSQELNREVNTICSKSQYSALTKIGIEMKILVDQFREQVQNVE